MVSPNCASMWSTLACGSLRNSSSRPSSRISSSVEGWMVSPRKSRRKSPCFSSTTTSMPPRASRKPSIIPAGPPPAMQHFVMIVFSTMETPSGSVNLMRRVSAFCEAWSPSPSSGRVGVGSLFRGVRSKNPTQPSPKTGRDFSPSTPPRRRRRRGDRGRLRACHRDGGSRRRHGPWCRNSARRATSTSCPAESRRSTRWPSKPCSRRRLVTVEPQVRPSSQRGRSSASASGWR